MESLDIMKSIISMASKLLNGYPCRIGENKFDTIDIRWILLDPLVFMSLIGTVQMYIDTEQAYLNEQYRNKLANPPKVVANEKIIEEAIRVGLSQYMAGGKNLQNMSQSQDRIMKIMKLDETGFNELKKFGDEDSFLLNCLTNLENMEHDVPPPEEPSRIIIP